MVANKQYMSTEHYWLIICLKIFQGLSSESQFFAKTSLALFLVLTLKISFYLFLDEWRCVNLSLHCQVGQRQYVLEDMLLVTNIGPLTK